MILSSRYAAVALLALPCAVLSPVMSRAESLADVVAYADETNPGLQAQRASLRALDETYVQARGNYGLNISGSIGASSYNERLSGQSFYANTTSATLSATQPLYTGGRVNSQLNAAMAQILAGREELRRFEIDLLQRVVTAYVDVRRDEELLKINQDTVSVLEREVADTQARFDVRDVTMTDVAQTKARLADARIQLSNATASLAVSRAQFLSTIGQNPGGLEPPPELVSLPSTIDQAFDSAENNNPQLLGAKYTEQSSRAKISEARAQGRPSISAQFNIQNTPYLPYTKTPYNDASSAVVTLSQPIFASGQISSGIRQAVEQNSRDRLGIDDARQQVILSVTSTWAQLSNTRNQLRSFNDQVKDNEYAFYGVNEEKKFALRQTIEVLNAELELTTAQQNLVRARAQEYILRIQLLAATGVLTPEMLSSSVNHYDPAANFRRVRNKGSTPLEWPARTLDAIGSPRIGPPPPASLAEAVPKGEAMPPAPDSQDPIQSILSMLDKPPPEPK